MGEKSEGKFNVAVGAIVEHPTEKKILLIFRNPKIKFNGGIWEYPIGRMKQFETPEEGLKRELSEETGLEVEIVKVMRAFHMFRGEETAENELIGILYWVKAKSDKVKLSGEHVDFRWVSTDEGLELVTHKGVRRALEAFLQENSTNLSSS